MYVLIHFLTARTSRKKSVQATLIAATRIPAYYPNSFILSIFWKLYILHDGIGIFVHSHSKGGLVKDATKQLPRYQEEERPWGGFKRLTHNEQTTVKIITVNAGQSISLQRHQHRDEYWYVCEGTGIIHIDGVDYEAREGNDFFCPRGCVHRVSGGPEGTTFIEIAFGEFDEGDIERLEDRYGRT
jgi:mannose-6-phosphate isomerase-like protein (cupin superfamily)